jgi:hypothetical protein
MEGTALQQTTVTYHWNWIGGGMTLPLNTHNYITVYAHVLYSPTGLAESKVTGGSRDVDSGNADPTHQIKGDSLTDNKGFGNASTTVAYSYGVYTFAWNATGTNNSNDANAFIDAAGY